MHTIFLDILYEISSLDIIRIQIDFYASSVVLSALSDGARMTLEQTTSDDQMHRLAFHLQASSEG